MTKNFANETSGTLKTRTATFYIILVFIIYIFAALTFFPALALGPIYCRTHHTHGLTGDYFMSKKHKNQTITPEILGEALIGSFKELNPLYMIKNPVMFAV